MPAEGGTGRLESHGPAESHGRTGAYLYPWDVNGDPAAADRIAGLGLTEVTLAAAYHAVRAVTPFHPEHRIVTRDAGVYYRPDPARWASLPLRPPAGGTGAAARQGSFERAAAALRAAGIAVTAWAVVTHNSRLAGPGERAVRNAFGDVYPWALCAASAGVRGYAAALAAEVAALAGVDAIELEACGWYGFEHGSAHDKTGDGAARAGTEGLWLLSLCFCAECGQAYRSPALTRRSSRPRSARPPTAARRWPPTRPRCSTRPGEAAALVGRSPRSSTRSAPPPLACLSWSTPRPIRAPWGPTPRPRPGRPARPGGADGIVLACGEPRYRSRPGRPHRGGRAARRPDRRRPAGRRQGLGGQPETLPAQAAAVRAAGATELRLYHARPGRAGRPGRHRGLLPGQSISS